MQTFTFLSKFWLLFANGKKTPIFNSNYLDETFNRSISLCFPFIFAKFKWTAEIYFQMSLPHIVIFWYVAALKMGGNLYHWLC